MKFWILRDGQISYTYKDDGDKQSCTKCITEYESGFCSKKRFADKISKDDETYIFCHDENVVKGTAKHISKITAASFSSIYNASKKKRADLTEIEIIAYHNAKKMNAQIGQKINKIISDNELASTKNKIDFIERKIKKDARSVAREILSARKIVQQIETEYNLIEILDMNQPFRDDDLTKIKAHQLLVSAFYLYEEDFSEKGITVKINPTQVELLVDFGVAKSAIGEIFQNSIKYCKKKTSIDISVTTDDVYSHLTFRMTSLHFSNEEQSRLTLKSFRGSQAQEIQGSGIGLFAVNAYMNLHKGKLSFHSSESTKHYYKNGYYSENTFTLSFPRLSEKKG